MARRVYLPGNMNPLAIVDLALVGVLVLVLVAVLVAMAREDMRRTRAHR